VLTAWRLWTLAKIPASAIVVRRLGPGLMLLSNTRPCSCSRFFRHRLCVSHRASRINWRSGRSLGRIAPLAGAPRHGFPPVWPHTDSRLADLHCHRAGWLTLPAAPYFQGGLSVSAIRLPHSFFLMGMHSSTGWWYYFLVVCLIKIPVAIFILPRGARLPGGSWDDMAPMNCTWSCLCLMFIYSLLFQHHSKMGSLSSAVIPFVHLARQLWSGPAAERRHANRVGFLPSGPLRHTPDLADYLAYFNEFIGGPRNGTIGWRLKFGWGQD